jgi:acetyl-CoA acetyltransferase
MQQSSSDLIADQRQLPRDELDRDSYASHEGAARAIDEGRCVKEILPAGVANPRVGERL